MSEEASAISKAKFEDTCIEEIARVFHISAHPQLRCRSCFIQPILSLNIISFSFLCREVRHLRCNVCGGREVSCEGGSREERLKTVVFVSIKIHTERARIVERSEVSFSVLRNKRVVVVRKVSEYI